MRFSYVERIYDIYRCVTYIGDMYRCVTKESMAGGLRNSLKSIKGRFLGNIFIFYIYIILVAFVSFFLDKELVRAFASFVLAICNH